MPVHIPDTDLSSAVVGTTGTIDLTRFRLQPTMAQLANNQHESMVLYNESGCGLSLTFDGSNASYFLAAGAWHEPIPISPNDTRIQWSVTYQLPNAPVTKLIGVYYQAAEYPIGASTLGNSPIGVSGQIVSTPAAAAIDQQLFLPFIINIPVPVKDGSIASQLDVSGGSAMLLQPQGYLQVRTNGFTAFSTLGNPSTTLFLDINPDGSYSFSQSHSVNPNALTICTVTTDGSSNISTVTDTRVLNTTFMLNMPSVGGGALTMEPPLNLAGGVTTVDSTVAGGALGIPVVCGSAGPALRTHITTTGSHNLEIVNAAITGLYRVSGFVRVNNSVSGNAVGLLITFFDPDKTGGTSDTIWMEGINGSSVVQLNNSNNIVNNPYGIMPVSFMHTGGKVITLSYTDPTNTPNDFISVAVERLA